MTSLDTVMRIHFFAGWEAAQTATVIAALIAVTGVVATILTAAARAGRDRKADLYANALGGVADYLEGPYRIRRKDGTATHRNAITSAISDVKSNIDHNQELLRLHAPTVVADAYDHYVLAARIEAGTQMKEAWDLPPLQADCDVNMGAPYARDLSAQYRSQTVQLMQADLARRAWKPWRSLRFAQHAQRALATPESRPQATDESVSESETSEKDTPTRR